MGDLTKQAQLLKKCVKLAVYIRSGREFVSILTMRPIMFWKRRVLWACFRTGEAVYDPENELLNSGATSRPFISKWKNRAS